MLKPAQYNRKQQGNWKPGGIYNTQCDRRSGLCEHKSLWGVGGGGLMKIKFLAVAKAPDKYSFNNEKITAYYKGNEETFDLNSLNELTEENTSLLIVDALDLKSSNIIREAYKADDEWHVILCQTS